MKFIHLSDLHLGKRVNEFSMIEDQKYILNIILKIIDSESPDGVILAGDIYDKSIPSAEAVQLFDDFLVKLSEQNIYVFVISGNHDSPERIAFGARIMNAKNIYLSPVYNGEVTPIVMADNYGKLNVYLLPFIKPSHVRRFFEDEEIVTYTDAVRTAINHMNIDKKQRNILVTHQFVTGAKTSDSEEISVGGADNVDVSVFKDFDYVALGHIHGPQYISSNTVRYCGTPLKYSFSEEAHEKSVTIVEINEKGCVNVRTAALNPLRDMRTVKGSYDEIICKDFYKNTNTDDYIQVILTDDNYIYNAIGKLRTVYTNIMKLEYDNKRTKTNTSISAEKDIENKSPLQLFSEFYEKQNNQSLNSEQHKYLEKIIEEIKEGMQ